jgi:hypothetical protein
MDEGNEKLVYPSPWDFKGTLTYERSYELVTPALLSIRSKVCCGFFIALKNASP